MIACDYRRTSLQGSGSYRIPADSRLQQVVGTCRIECSPFLTDSKRTMPSRSVPNSLHYKTILMSLHLIIMIERLVSMLQAVGRLYAIDRIICKNSLKSKPHPHRLKRPQCKHIYHDSLQTERILAAAHVKTYKRQRPFSGVLRTLERLDDNPSRISCRSQLARGFSGEHEHEREVS